MLLTVISPLLRVISVIIFQPCNTPLKREGNGCVLFYAWRQQMPLQEIVLIPMMCCLLPALSNVFTPILLSMMISLPWIMMISDAVSPQIISSTARLQQSLQETAYSPGPLIFSVMRSMGIYLLRNAFVSAT